MFRFNYYISTILICIKFYFFGIEGNILFKIKYFIEKVLHFTISILNSKFSMGIKNIYLINDDYILKTKKGNFYIKKHSDFDYYIQPYYEIGLLKYFKINDGIFIDIGAHLGKYSIKIAKECANAKIYAFEANPDTFEILSKNIELNNLEKRIFAINKGVSNKNDMIDFFTSNNTGISQIYNKENLELKDGKIIKINTITLDEFILENKINIDEIKLIKIDIEGYEYQALLGMENLLRNTKNIEIICEILNKDISNIKEFLGKFGFKYKVIYHPNYIFYK